MRKTAFAAAVSFLLFLAIPAFAVQSRNVVDDVIKMTKSGVAEETILDFVQKAPRYSITADDVVAMSEAGVPRAVVRAVVKNADTSSASSRDGVRDRQTVIVAPSYGYYPAYGYGTAALLGSSGGAGSRRDRRGTRRSGRRSTRRS